MLTLYSYSVPSIETHMYVCRKEFNPYINVTKDNGLFARQKNQTNTSPVIKDQYYASQISKGGQIYPQETHPCVYHILLSLHKIYL